MAQDNGTSSLEMGAGDQVALVATTASKKTIGYVIGTVAMLAVLGGVVATITVVSGGDAEPMVTTTPVVPVDPTTTSEPTTPEDSTTPAPTTASESTEVPTTPVDPTSASTTTAVTTEDSTTPQDTTTAATTEESTTPQDTTTAATTEETTTPQDTTTAATTEETTTPQDTTTAATTEETTTPQDTTTAATTEETTTPQDTTTAATTEESTTPQDTTTAATTEETTTPQDTTTAATTEESTTPQDTTTAATTEESTTPQDTTTAATTEETTTPQDTTTAATTEETTTPQDTTTAATTEETTTPQDTTTAATTEGTTTPQDTTTAATTEESTTPQDTTTAATTEETTNPQDTTTAATTAETTTPQDTTTAATTEETTTPQDTTTAATTEETTTPQDTTTAATTEESTTPQDTTTAATTEESTTPQDTTTAATTEETTTPQDTTTAATTEESTTPQDTTTAATTEESTTPQDTTTAATTEESTTPQDTTTPSTTPTTPPTTTDPPITDPPIPPLDLEEFITGAYSPSPFNATWSAGGEMFFRNGDGDLVLYDVDTDTTAPLISNETSQILQRSSRVMQLSADGNEVILAYDDIPMYRHSFLARYAAVNPTTQRTVYISPFVNNAEKSDDVPYLQNFVWGSGTALAFVFMNDIYYQNDLNSPPRQITANGQLNVIFNGVPDWVYEEEVFSSHNAIWFSKDGAKMAFATFDDTGVRIMKVPRYGEPGSLNYQYTQHHEIRYPKSGTANPMVSVTLLDVNTNVRHIFEAPADYPILKTVKFVTNLSIAVVWTNRVQTQMRVQLCSVGQITCSVIFSHNEPNGWIDKVPLFFNGAGTAFITIIPQDVGGNLYKQIVQASEPPTTGTAGEEWTPQNRVNTAHTVLEILSWSSDNTIWYKATSEEDSAEQHIYTVTSAGTVTCFTCGIRREDGGECLYNEATLSNAGDRITINCAGPGVPQVLIFDTDGTLIRVWNDNAELSAITNNRELPTTIRLSVPIGTGLPAADVNIQVPVDYATRTDVPLLVYVYGGPDTALVTKKWSLDWGSFLVSQWGIAVAHIDGRGSGLRGVSNMFALNGKLGTVEVEDQITVTKYLQNNLDWIDGKRTCIWGWSYGGYAATKALAEGGDVFKCAAAVAPVVDWRFYDTIYTERYMGLPTENEADYSASTLLTDELVESLRDKSYFLIHGTADDNVHYQHAMMLSRLLQRRSVYFNQMSYTDQHHSLVGVRPHLYHALEKFLKEHML